MSESEGERQTDGDRESQGHSIDFMSFLRNWLTTLQAVTLCLLHTSQMKRPVYELLVVSGFLGPQ